MGNRMSYGFTKLYLPPDSGKFPAFTPSRRWYSIGRPWRDVRLSWNEHLWVRIKHSRKKCPAWFELGSGPTLQNKQSTKSVNYCWMYTLKSVQRGHTFIITSHSISWRQSFLWTHKLKHVDRPMAWKKLWDCKCRCKNIVVECNIKAVLAVTW